jgi:predicted lipoprotein with Yx(FWY)xxD motif
MSVKTQLLKESFNMRKLTLATALSLLISAPLFAAPAMTGDSTKGEILTDAQGMSLYTFDKDTNGLSACYDACAQNWPPLLAEVGAEADGDFAISERSDGGLQWTYKGAPLYGFVKDQNAGDITGDGLKGVWHLARP